MSSSVVQEQPQAVPSPSKFAALKESVGHFQHKFTTKDGWVGDYDYAWYVRPPKFRAQYVLSIGEQVMYAHIAVYEADEPVAPVLRAQ